MKKLYKAHAQFKDEFCNFEIKYYEYDVIDETPCYYIIIQYGNYKKNRKKVAKDSQNGFAFDTKEKALHNLIKRRQRYQHILEVLVEKNKEFLNQLK